MKRQYRNPQKPNCENCGTIDELEWFEWVMDGITLCQDCADLSVNKISRKNVFIKWVKVDGDYYPANFPISKREA